MSCNSKPDSTLTLFILIHVYGLLHNFLLGYTIMNTSILSSNALLVRALASFKILEQLMGSFSLFFWSLK